MMIEVSRPPEYARTTFFAIDNSSMSAGCSRRAQGPACRMLVVDRQGLGSAGEQEHQCFLRVHAIFGLVEDYGLRPVEHSVGNFGVAMRWQAVHKDRVCRSPRHQRLVDLVRLEDRGA